MDLLTPPVSTASSTTTILPYKERYHLLYAQVCYIVGAEDLDQDQQRRFDEVVWNLHQEALAGGDEPA